MRHVRELPPVKVNRELPPLLVSVEEAADALSLSRSKVYELLGAGALPSVYVGRCRRIEAAALQDFVVALRSSTSTTAAGGSR